MVTGIDSTINNDLPIHRVTVDGKVCSENLAAIESRLIDEIKELYGDSLLLDFRNVDYIDSRGISLCIRIFKQCLARKTEFFMEVNPKMYNLFKTTDLTRTLNIKEVDH